MILTCNSCGKKFVVPDNAITASGRMVQCGSCGNKWKQFPLEEAEKTPYYDLVKTEGSFSGDYREPTEEEILAEEKQAIA